MAENPSTTNPVLKPCPFCGGSAFVNVFWAGAHFHEVTCSSCKAKSPPTENDGEAEAIAAWNRRPPNADAEKLAEALGTLYGALRRIADGHWIGADGKKYAIAEPSSVEQKIARAALSKATEGR